MIIGFVEESFSLVCRGVFVLVVVFIVGRVGVVEVNKVDLVVVGLFVKFFWMFIFVILLLIVFIFVLEFVGLRMVWIFFNVIL